MSDTTTDSPGRTPVGLRGADVERWCQESDLECTVANATAPVEATVYLEGKDGFLAVEIDGPTRPADPIRVRHAFELPAGAELAADRLTALLEAAVLQRSALVDARMVGPRTVEMVSAIYPDGISRHNFMTALFECRKLRQIVLREAESALVSEAAMASLETLAEASEELADAVEREAHHAAQTAITNEGVPGAA